MGFPWAAVIGGGASLLGGLLSGRKKARTQESTFQQTGTTTPFFGPEFEELKQEQLNQILARLRQSTDLSGFKAEGLSNINRQAQFSQQALENRLSSQGLLGSPVAGTAMANLELGRGGEQVRFLNQIPLLQREMQGQDLSQALALLGMGRGTTQTSSGTSTGVVPGSGAGGGFQDLGLIIGLLSATGAFGGKKPPGPIIPSWT